MLVAKRNTATPLLAFEPDSLPFPPTLHRLRHNGFFLCTIYIIQNKITQTFCKYYFSLSSEYFTHLHTALSHEYLEESNYIIFFHLRILSKVL